MNSIDRMQSGRRRISGDSDDGNSGRAKNAAPKSSGRPIWIVNLVLLSIIIAVMYFFIPQTLHSIGFNMILRHGWYLAPWIAIAYMAYAFGRKHNVLNNGLRRMGRPITVLITFVVLAVVANLLTAAGTDYLTYKIYASDFQARDGLIPSAPDFVRFTPYQNACNDIGNTISTTGEHIDCDYVQPMIGEHGFAYAAPITMSGAWNVWFGHNPGFMVLDDSKQVYEDPQKRLTRIDEKQYVGQGMQWFDDLDYVLPHTDFFANYDTPHFLALDPKEPGKLTLIVPKIKYGFFFRFPHWGGDVLVHSDGSVEDLSVEQAKADPRLAGKWIYPMSLARDYVDLQNYAAGDGIITPFVRLSGRLEIEELEGKNKFPFLTKGSDGKGYFVTATKGLGSAKGLFRMYYVDINTGVGTYHQFGPHEIIYGAGASAARITNVQGYQWHRESGDSSSGTMIGIEPVYIVRPHDPTLYWKFTITNVNFSGISATAVVNASKPDEINVFTKRADFEAWLSGAAVAPVAQAAGSSTPQADILLTIEGLKKQLDKLEGQVKAMQK